MGGLSRQSWPETHNCPGSPPGLTLTRSFLGAQIQESPTRKPPFWGLCPAGSGVRVLSHGVSESLNTRTQRPWRYGAESCIY